MPSMDDVYARPGEGARPSRTDLGTPQPDRKPCDRCGVVKVLTDFAALRQGGWSGWCKTCWSSHTIPEPELAATDKPQSRGGHDLYEPEGREGIEGCNTCGGAEGDMPTHCPGSRMPLGRAEEVYAGRIDFLDGAWRPTVPRKQGAGPGIPVPAPTPFVPDAADTSWTEGTVKGGPLAKLTNNPNADALVQDMARLVDRPLPAVIETDEQRLDVVNLIIEGKRAEASMEALRKKLVEPIKAVAKAIDDAMGPSSPTRRDFAGMRHRADVLLAAFNAHQNAVRARQAQEAQRQQQDAAVREAAAVEAAGSAQTEQERHQAMALADQASLEQAHAAVDESDAARPVRGVITDAGRVTFGERWTFEVLKLDDVPRVFLKLDEQKVRTVIAGGVRELPGINIFPMPTTSVRAR